MPTSHELDATPSKEIYRSIIADYSFNTGICELIDNAIDVWSRAKDGRTLAVDITLDLEQKFVSIEDNAGGVGRSDLVYLVRPGASSLEQDGASIGVFGVGCKRGPIALAQRINIYTQQPNAPCWRISYDDDWLASDDWKLAAVTCDREQPSRTRIELSQLRGVLDQESTERLKTHLGKVYANFLSAGDCVIRIGSAAIPLTLFNDWAFPPGYEPHSQEFLIPLTEDEIVAKITVGLKNNRNGEDDYGVYFYCNKRLIAEAVRNHEVGFHPGGAGKEHHDVSLVRAIVEFHGSARQMPWNSSKSGINFQHRVFRHIQPWLHTALKKYGALCRALKHEWGETVFPHVTGTIVQAEPSFGDAHVRTFTLPTPRSRQTYEQRMAEANETITERLPWSKGLYEGVVATDVILRKTTLTERNRIALILLDSTIEIALKDYLVHNVGIGRQTFQRICENRAEVQKLAAQHAGDLVSPSDWDKLGYYYHLRCDLIHRRASAGIGNEQINDFRQLIQRVLHKLIGLRFVEP